MCLEETVIIPMRLNNGFPYYVVTFVDDRKLQSTHLRIFSIAHESSLGTYGGRSKEDWYRKTRAEVTVSA